MIRSGAILATLAAGLLSLVLSDPASAERRLALVVGNGGYAAENATPLDNPVNDARLIAGTLETVGFEVRLVTDVDRAALVEEIDGFGERLERAGSDAVGLFYYAGHGVEARGRNYLMPLGARIGREQHLRTRAVSAELVLSWMEEAGNGLNIVVLDACRDNPYGEGNRGGARGLAPMDAPSGSVIAYAAAPGQAAKDGDGENSPYTAALARALVQPGLRIEDVFKQVRREVADVTGGEQTPWENTSLFGDFHFVPPGDTESGNPDPIQVGGEERMATERLVADRVFWESVKNSSNPADFEAYLGAFNEGLFASLARNRLRQLVNEDAVVPLEPIGPNWSVAENQPCQVYNDEPNLRYPVTWSGACVNGRVSGEGRLVRRINDGESKYVGSMLGGKRHGTGTHTWADGARYEGEWLDDKRHGTGIQTWVDGGRYEGEYRDGKKHGTGTYTWVDGGRYVGEWLDDKRHGTGTHTWADGARYEGEYRDGKKHGTGTQTSVDGGRYVGEWLDDKRHGTGIQTWVDGGRYVGEWLDDKVHGTGTYTWADGARYEGEYRDGKRHGTGTYTWADGGRYEGEWLDGKMHGAGTHTWASGTTTTCEWQEGKVVEGTCK